MGLNLHYISTRGYISACRVEFSSSKRTYTHQHQLTPDLLNLVSYSPAQVSVLLGLHLLAHTSVALQLELLLIDLAIAVADEPFPVSILQALLGTIVNI